MEEPVGLHSPSVTAQELNIMDGFSGQALREGRTEAYEMIFRQWYTPLCRFACSLLHDADESEDVVQHIFVRMWENREALAVEVSVKAYLFRSVRNSCLNVIKHRKIKDGYSKLAVSTSQTSDDSGGNSHEQMEERLELALTHLPPKCRQVFEMSRFGGKRYQDIADELGISIKTVENHMAKALRIMREHLNDLMPLLLFFNLLHL